MNDTNKKSLSQQKAIKNSFLKFSNTVLFENRERNLSSRKDLNPKKQKKINSSKKYNFRIILYNLILNKLKRILNRINIYQPAIQELLIIISFSI